MKAWLVTGSSSGLGLAIAERNLAGYRGDIDAWRDITIATRFRPALSSGRELCLNVNTTGKQS